MTAALSKERPELRHLERDQTQHRSPTRTAHRDVALGRGADTGSVATAQDDSVLRHGTTATRDAVTDVSHCAGPVPPGGDATPATPQVATQLHWWRSMTPLWQCRLAKIRRFQTYQQNFRPCLMAIYE